LTVTAEITELKPLRRGNGHGIARLQYRVTNQENVLVATFIDNHVVKLKGRDGAPGSLR